MDRAVKMTTFQKFIANVIYFKTHSTAHARIGTNSSRDTHKKAFLENYYKSYSHILFTLENTHKTKNASGFGAPHLASRITNSTRKIMKSGSQLALINRSEINESWNRFPLGHCMHSAIIGLSKNIRVAYL